jgi:hypothetical protein
VVASKAGLARGHLVLAPPSWPARTAGDGGRWWTYLRSITAPYTTGRGRWGQRMIGAHDRAGHGSDMASPSLTGGLPTRR